MKFICNIEHVEGKEIWICICYELDSRLNNILSFAVLYIFALLFCHFSGKKVIVCPFRSTYADSSQKESAAV